MDTVKIEIDYTKLKDIAEKYTDWQQTMISARYPEGNLQDGVGGLHNYDYGTNTQDWNKLHSHWIGTYIEELYYKIIEVLPEMGRLRFMTMDGRSCYSIHKDFDGPRLHIPVIGSKEEGFFVINDVVHRLDYDKCYLVDVRQPHTYVWTGDYPRVHIVGNLGDFEWTEEFGYK